jgi:hypothetical protein
MTENSNVQDFVPLIDRLGIKFLWVWDDEDKVYRNDETGDIMDEETMIALRDQIVDWQVDFFSKWPLEEEEKPKDDKDANILALLLLGFITLGVWERRMRAAIQDAVVMQYVIARGGEDMMTAADWSFLETYILGQYSFLNGFAQAIFVGDMSEAEIANRSTLYFSSIVSAFERGRMKAQHQDLNLTRHPGDGTSECLARDKCFWHYSHTESTIVCSWVRTAAESCDTCIIRSGCPPVQFIRESGEQEPVEGIEDEFIYFE